MRKVLLHPCSPRTLLLVIAALLAMPASAAKYLDVTPPDLVRLLPSPPANDSPQTRSELDELLQLQRERTPRDVDYARANIEIGVQQFAGALGDEAGLKKALPASVKSLFDAARADEKKLLDAAKMHFDRPRPVALDAHIQPCLEPIVNMAYPSGHATWVFMTAVLLADMVPERREAIWARAEDFARQRLVGGVHYRSDIDAGRIAGTVIAAFMLASPSYRADAAVAAADLRNFLKLHPPGDVLPRKVASSPGTPLAGVAVARDLQWFETAVFAAPLAR
jgi:acid phosphatase (class A)